MGWRRGLLSAGVAALALSAGGYAVVSKQPKGVAPRITHKCGDAIDMSPTPYGGFKVLFGRIGVPRDDHVLQSIYQPSAQPFHYATKYGFAIKAGTSPVDVRVSASWHSRLALSGASAIRFRGCPDTPAETPWLGYANVYTVKQKACVSIIVTVDGQSARVRLPLGVSCPPPAAG